MANGIQHLRRAGWAGGHAGCPQDKREGCPHGCTHGGQVDGLMGAGRNSPLTYSALSEKQEARPRAETEQQAEAPFG